MIKKGSDMQISMKAALFITVITFIWASGLSFAFFFMAHSGPNIKQYLPSKINQINHMMNATEFAFINRFGTPDFRQTLGATNLIQYRSLKCSMAIYLAPYNEEYETKVSKKITLLNRTDLTQNNNCLNDFIGTE